MKKFFVSAAALLMAAAPLAASAQPMGFGHSNGGRQLLAVQHNNGFRGGDNNGWRDDRGGAALAFGLFGLIAGAALASSHDAAYDQPAAYGYDYGQCGWQTEAVRGPYGRVTYQQVQLCN
ncbi:MAG TPA: hypothetical protein VGI95_07710 [Caulobacteraceae bacterium]|jgi:hypothetical protein